MQQQISIYGGQKQCSDVPPLWLLFFISFTDCKLLQKALINVVLIKSKLNIRTQHTFGIVCLRVRKPILTTKGYTGHFKPCTNTNWATGIRNASQMLLLSKSNCKCLLCSPSKHVIYWCANFLDYCILYSKYFKTLSRQVEAALKLSRLKKSEVFRCDTSVNKLNFITLKWVLLLYINCLRNMLSGATLSKRPGCYSRASQLMVRKIPLVQHCTSLHSLSVDESGAGELGGWRKHCYAGSISA